VSFTPATEVSPGAVVSATTRVDNLDPAAEVVTFDAALQRAIPEHFKTLEPATMFDRLYDTYPEEP